MDCPVVELRQYTLHPAARDSLIELFDREFVHTQEAVGIRVLGQFRDLDDPDRFVWMRGFADMESRRRSLESFYGGRVWAAHRDAANATMIDSDDVLLLRPSSDSPALVTSRSSPAAGYVIVVGPRAVCASTLVGGALVGVFETEPATNTFPALPVREVEDVVVSVHRMHAMPEHGVLSDELATSGASAILRLSPTAGSALR